MRLARITAITIALAATAPALSVAEAVASRDEPKLVFSDYVSEGGDIRLPRDFRRRFVHLGSFFVPEEPGAPGPGLHDVYTQPAAVTAYRETREFPDGTVLVKEVRSTTSQPLTTGEAHWATDVGVWFVMVRDRKGRFPEHPNFGAGWGWALFKADAPTTNAASSWKGEGFSNCYGCHLPAQQTGWVYIQGYPTLHEAPRDR